MKKTYISGQITGIETEAPLLFEAAEKKLKKLGFETINPITINHDHHDKSWVNYMREDIKALCNCDNIYILSNWVSSRGAIIEHTIASYLGLQVFYEIDFEKWYKNHYTKSDSLLYTQNDTAIFQQNHLIWMKDQLLPLRKEIKELLDATSIELPHNYQDNRRDVVKHYVALVLGIEIIYTKPKF